MRFYQVQHMGDFCEQHGEWFTTRREAEKRRREIERDWEVKCYSVQAYDIPTTKKALLDWLNIYGNPNGFGGC
jgi:hypothetical protein